MEIVTHLCGPSNNVGMFLRKALEENELGFMRGSSTDSERALQDSFFRDNTPCYL